MAGEFRLAGLARRLAGGTNAVIFVTLGTVWRGLGRRTAPFAGFRIFTKKMSSLPSRTIPSDTWLMRPKELKRS